MIHLETGHELISTFVKERPESPDGFVMVHAIFPGMFDMKPAKVWAHNEWKILDENIASRTADRSMVMSDMRGNAFRCDVELVQFNVLTNEEIVVVVQYPCTNALFGPSSIAALVEKEEDELIVTGALVAPSFEDPFGCDSGDSNDGGNGMDSIDTLGRSGTPVEFDTPINGDANVNVNAEMNGAATESTTCANTVVQMVHRGECSFLEKAMNQKFNQLAEGVIVINSSDDEVFIMSYGQEDLSLLEERLPATVLINGSHGSALMDAATMAEQLIGDDTFLAARIRVRRQDHHDDHSVDDDDDDDDGDIESDDERNLDGENSQSQANGDDTTNEPVQVQFPVVNASPTALRVLAKGGWGIQAVSQVEDSITNWHLQLMHHELEELSES